MSSKVIDNLVEKAKRGNIEAFGLLYETYSKDMYKFAYYYLGSAELAEDCIGECVLIAFEKIGELRKSSAFRSWLFKILYNCCNKALSEKIRARELIDIYSLRDLADNQKDMSEAAALKNALARLSEEERTIVSLHYIAGYTGKEIGRLLKLKDSTVRSKLMRALEKLRAMLHTEEVLK